MGTVTIGSGLRGRALHSLSLPTPPSPARLRPLSPDTRWCHGGLLACKCVPQQRFHCYDWPICHRVCSLPTALGPELVSEQHIPTAWWIRPLAALSSGAAESEGPLPPSFPLPAFCFLFFFLFSVFQPLRVLHITLILFFLYLFFPPYPPTPLQRNISQQGCGSARGPNCHSGGCRITLPDGALMFPRISRCSDSS